MRFLAVVVLLVGARFIALVAAAAKDVDCYFLFVFGAHLFRC